MVQIKHDGDTFMLLINSLICLVFKEPCLFMFEIGIYYFIEVHVLIQRPIYVSTVQCQRRIDCRSDKPPEGIGTFVEPG